MFRNGIGTGEIILLLAVVLLLFGAKRLPDTARGLGRSLRIFKAETKGLGDDDDTTTTTTPTPPAALPQPAADAAPPVAPPAVATPPVATPADPTEPGGQR